MICMGEAGMKRVLFKIIVPVLILVLWILMCYQVCQQENGFDYFLFWIMVVFLERWKNWVITDLIIRQIVIA